MLAPQNPNIIWHNFRTQVCHRRISLASGWWVVDVSSSENRLISCAQQFVHSTQLGCATSASRNTCAVISSASFVCFELCDSTTRWAICENDPKAEAIKRQLPAELRTDLKLINEFSLDLRTWPGRAGLFNQFVQPNANFGWGSRKTCPSLLCVLFAIFVYIISSLLLYSRTIL